MPTTKPDSTEAAEYYFKYINQIPAGDIRTTLASQQGAVLSLLQGISDADSLGRYAPDKWTIREVVSHLSDTERVFACRAFWFARGFDSPMPGFDQDVAVAQSAANDRSWANVVDEFRAVRDATVALFRDLPAEAWTRRGVASGHPVSVRGLAWISAGHVAHHIGIVRARYLTAV